MPLFIHPRVSQDRASRFLSAYGLLKKGTSLEQARDEFADFTRRMETLHPKTNLHTRSRLLDLHAENAGDGKESMLLLFAAVGIVLLITCTNVANLLLAKAVMREREMAIRISLGASQQRLIRQLITESLLLGIVGGLLGLAVARFGLDLFNLAVRENITRGAGFQPDWRVLAYGLVVSLLAGFIFGMAPAWHHSRVSLNESLKETGSNVSSSREKRRSQKILVGVEIALSVMLLIGAGLLMHSLWRVWQVDPGFQPERVIYAMLYPSRLQHATQEQVSAFYSQVLSRLESIPGVEKASLNWAVPMAGIGTSGGISRIAERPGIVLSTNSRIEAVGPGYFDTLRIPIKRGRDFSELDRKGAPLVAIINEAMAHRYWGNLDPIGSHLLDENELITVIGVVGNTHHSSLESPADPIYYFPFAQQRIRQWMFAVVRGSPGAAGLTGRIKQELQSMDATLFVDQPKLLEKSLRLTMTDRNKMLILIGSFALLALVLTLSGVYGVLSHFVAQRTREIGIRMAMGANAAALIRMVMRQALWTVMAGIAAGLMAAFALSRYFSGQLFGITREDPATYLGTALLFLLVTSTATYFPARRATRIDPVEALRAE